MLRAALVTEQTWDVCSPHVGQPASQSLLHAFCQDVNQGRRTMSSFPGHGISGTNPPNPPGPLMKAKREKWYFFLPRGQDWQQGNPGSVSYSKTLLKREITLNTGRINYEYSDA